ncbi:hypothetical protein CDAR_560511 [Caerostris darwini]|uniref:Uncharacterized protein n=1 Tax=Caerostris darwini TaxID=1538125 RepID=A0AAV4W0N2_9ARAC|nr:hypothetical protein CDAR_560251 [Caerostris darwini]GIY75696.1 hypothetical protein CDAR_560511 [Caerostris darwini]
MGNSGINNKFYPKQPESQMSDKKQYYSKIPKVEHGREITIHRDSAQTSRWTVPFFRAAVMKQLAKGKCPKCKSCTSSSPSILNHMNFYNISIDGHLTSVVNLISLI